MPFALSLYLYKVFQEKAQKEFEKKNKILYSKDIKNLSSVADKSRVIKILKSAVVSHDPVEGAGYYLMAPVAPLLCHDHFKQCLIADMLGRYAGGLKGNELSDALLILDTLRDPSLAGYVQVFAWEALGRWAREMPGLFDGRRDDLLKAFGGTTASLLGALLFLDSVLLTYQKQKALGLIAEGKTRVRYKVQQALLGYFLMRNQHCQQLFAAPDTLDTDMKSFLRECRGSGFISRQNFEEGAVELGFASAKQGSILRVGTQQADIVRRLKRICNDDLSAVGFFIKEYW